LHAARDAPRNGGIPLGRMGLARNDVTPVEAGKRVVDVLSTTFG
jgi:hypothetical protein